MTETVVDEGTLTFGHSPDPDDAFMFYGFHAGDVHVEVREGERLRRWRVEHELQDILTLHERALEGELEDYIVAPALGDDAGIRGAVELARRVIV